ncbi:DUF1559 domain-containing protein [uncultured Gimesia sp.]|uniref:DUF1559 family PulG-like putative transporter n=1 Tax=uncultured Gimesia sp. TaxID=1678688 RepID=UPI00260A43A0|nr:DUF1559 domain-containing protein [uncultured Gimesia sp.]
MQPFRSNAFTRWELVTILVIVAILCLLLVPDVQQAVNSGQRERFRNQIRAIGVALHEYQTMHGCLPPAALRDAKGDKPQHSWRALLLPHLEPSFKSTDHRYDYRFDEPWNSSHNQMIATEKPHFYRLIITQDDKTPRTSQLVAIIDNSTYWSPTEDCRSLMSHHEDEPRIILMEISMLNGLWNEPKDITLDELEKMIAADVFAIHGSHVLFDNGRRHWLSPEEVNVPNMRKLLRVKTNGSR